MLLFMANKTGIAFAFFLMTGFTGFHGHNLRGITGDPFIVNNGVVFRFSTYRSVTDPAFQLGHFDVGGMGEKNMVRLFGINEPGNIFIFLLELFSQFQKGCFFRGITLG